MSMLFFKGGLVIRLWRGRRTMVYRKWLFALTMDTMNHWWCLSDSPMHQLLFNVLWILSYNRIWG